MREHLLGYLMGALDASQQKQVEQALENDPQLRRELALLSEALEPLRADRGLHEPPQGLADRTLDVVAAVAGWPEEVGPSGGEPALDPAAEGAADERHQFLSGFFGSDNSTHDAGDDTGVPAECEPPSAASSSAGAKASHGRSGGLAPVRETVGRAWGDCWALLDVVASAGVVAAAAMLFFPAIANSRYQARVVACQSNLQTIGQALETYSDTHNGAFVPIPVEGNASISGVYAATLKDDGYVDQDQAFFCAGDLAARAAAPEEFAGERRIPTLAELEQAFGPELRRLQRLAGGSYGYNLGYMTNGRYRPLRNLGRSTFVILADAPGPQRAGRHSMHHGGRGQNVLFEDGHIEFLVGSMTGDFDEIFFSDRNLVEAGLHPDDAVIGDSHSRPMLSIIPVSR